MILWWLRRVVLEDYEASRLQARIQMIESCERCVSVSSIALGGDMLRSYVIGCCLALPFSASVDAQVSSEGLRPPTPASAEITVRPSEQRQALVVGGPVSSQLSRGTQFPVRLLRELTTKGKALHVGDRFDLETVDPIRLGDVTVFPSGTRVIGEITSVKNKGMWGKSGKFQARLLYLRVGNRDFRVTGQFDDRGKGGGWAAGLTTAFVLLPVGFFMTGTSATVPAGAVITAELDEDVPVVVASSSSKPIEVTAPARSD